MAIIILCLWSPSPKHRHDFHRQQHDTMISIILIYINVLSHGRLANYCSCNYCYRIAIIVKQFFGACILCNKETTIRFLPVVDNFNKTWSSHTTIYISSRLDHITSQHALQKQVDILYFVVASFTWLLRASSKNRSYLRIKTTTIFRQVCCFNLQQGPAVVKFDSTKVGETDTRQPPVCKARR